MEIVGEDPVQPLPVTAPGGPLLRPAKAVVELGEVHLPGKLKVALFIPTADHLLGDISPPKSRSLFDYQVHRFSAPIGNHLIQ